MSAAAFTVFYTATTGRGLLALNSAATTAVVAAVWLPDWWDAVAAYSGLLIVGTVLLLVARRQEDNDIRDGVWDGPVDTLRRRPSGLWEDSHGVLFHLGRNRWGRPSFQAVGPFDLGGGHVSV